MLGAAQSISTLIRRVEASLDVGGINASLEMVHNYVEQIITNPLCTSRVFASQSLDSLCLLIGRYSLEHLSKHKSNSHLTRCKKNTIVYLVSRLQRSGGHSRLVQDFIRAQPGKNHLILSTEVGGPSDYDYFLEYFAEEANIQFILASGGNFQARLAWLQAFLLASRPEHVFLFNHHQDSVAVSALVPELKLAGSFCHHGDHHLCLGVFLTHLTHLDLHPMGYHYCRSKLGIDNNYLPLTIEDKSVAKMPQWATGGSRALMTATAARYNKIEVPYYVSYFDLIPQILAITKGRHLHIGKLSPWGLRRLYANLSSRGIEHDRFVYIEWSPSVWKTLVAHQVDLYLASFPYGAALTLIEAMGAGLPVIMHQHLYSRVLSCLELAYDEAFSWADPQDLLTHLASLSYERLQQEGVLARLRYEQYHMPQILKAYLDGENQISLAVPPLRKEFQPRWDEWASWVNSQMTYSGLLRLNVIRALRRLRAWITQFKAKMVDIFADVSAGLPKRQPR